MEKSICPVARSLDIIGDWWSLLIIRDAFAGRRRFSEFERSLGVAKNILTTRLRSLVAEDILRIAPASDGSAYQEYVLTEKGEALLPVLVALGQWGRAHLFTPGETCSTLLDAKHKRPLRELEIRSEDGRRLELSDVLVQQSPNI